MLHLLLLGASVADHRQFDGERRILGDFQSSGSGGQHGHAADLAELERRLHVKGIENSFDGDFIGLMFGDDGAELVKDLREAAGSASRGESLIAPQVRQ